jgi:hypothetical protein
MLIICWDSLRLDAIEPFKGILGEESWNDIPSIDGFTGPILPSVVCGSTPEKLGVPRDDSAFWSGINPKNIEDTIFDHFDDYITISRLIGPQTMPHTKLVPSRRGKLKFMPPIKFNAQSNWDIDIWRYFGNKWSMSSDYWVDMIFFWTFITHGNFSCYDSLGAVESPEIKNGGLVMRRLQKQDPQALRDLYMMGVYNGSETLKGLNEISGGKELIVCFSDHNECLNETMNGQLMPPGHYKDMHKIPGLERVPIWVNRPNVEFPENMTQSDIKDWIVKLRDEYEDNDEEYQEFKRKKLEMKNGNKKEEKK